MADMKFQFTIQPYQTEAVDSVVNVFAGQGFHGHTAYRRDGEGIRTADSWLRTEEQLYTGYANAAVGLSASQLLENIRKIQAQNNIKLSHCLTDGLGACSLDVEMETGTGKTYVYIKTMFELNQRYGWSKFIVVVPSIAIREGVRKSFDTMQEHFMEHYGKKARAFVYDSKNLAQLDQFCQSGDLNVMIINIQAFNARGKDARRIRSELDIFGSRRPIDAIGASRPIVILDEPQKMGGRATQDGLREFDPLFCLNYSATHRQHHDLVYVLDALDAYNRQLVKRIEVKGFDLRNLQGMDGYLFLEEIVISPKKPPTARLELEIGYNKSINRETRLVGVGDDLFRLSKHMEQYRGFCVSEVDPVQGRICFTNGEVLYAGQVVGDISESDLRRIQIRETIRSHLEKERELFPRGIKTLSLFFLDEVAKYRKYDEDGNEVNSQYAQIFEQEYTAVLEEYCASSSTPYQQYLRGIPVHRTHAGYFSIDKKGRKVDSSLKRGSDESDDISAYDLILRDKERLLSFDNPVRFLFSHSALREGWDNPNVFQICALKRGGGSPTQKRQEVGRGLRLCVSQRGERMDGDMLGTLVQEVNQLTVIASDGYRDFVTGLQSGIRDDLYDRPTQATAEYFIGKTVSFHGGSVTISEKQGKAIYRYLIKNDYIDEDDHITQRYRDDLAGGVLAPVPDSCEDIAGGVHVLIQSIFDEHILDSMIPDGHRTKLRENPLNENFNCEEFQSLWAFLRQKYAYTVEFDSEALIQRAIAHIDERMFVSELQYTVTTGEQGRNWSLEQLKNDAGFVTESRETFTLERKGGSFVQYDLIGKIAQGVKLTRKSAAKILAGIKPHVFEMFRNNPEEFIAKAVRLINEQKALLIVEGITYHPIDGKYELDIFQTGKTADVSRAYRGKKSVQDYVFTDGYARDGQSVERRFAEEMDLSKEVRAYAKLPKGFSIPTPLGSYSPDWAVAFHKGLAKHAFFVAETKGTMDSLQLKPVESAKIACAKKLFAGLAGADIVYHEVDSYAHMLEIMKTL